MKPVIKWTGSKRSQAASIIAEFPDRIACYYEPFVGGGSVAGALMEKGANVGRYVLSDINGDLINPWNAIKSEPDAIAKRYAELWSSFNLFREAPHRKAVFAGVKEHFNETRDPADFFFLTRTSLNGLVRYNSKNLYNSSCHFSRPGIDPSAAEEIIKGWSAILNANDVEFECADYRDALSHAGAGDFAYLDPPYFGTATVYGGTFDANELFETVKKLNCRWALSYNGESQGACIAVPEDLYDEKKTIRSGNSSFARIKGTDLSRVIYESLYIKRI